MAPLLIQNQTQQGGEVREPFRNHEVLGRRYKKMKFHADYLGFV